MESQAKRSPNNDLDLTHYTPPPSLQAGGRRFEPGHVHQSYPGRSIICSFGRSVGIAIGVHLDPIKRSSAPSWELHKRRLETRRRNSE